MVQSTQPPLFPADRPVHFRATVHGTVFGERTGSADRGIDVESVGGAGDIESAVEARPVDGMRIDGGKRVPIHAQRRALPQGQGLLPPARRRRRRAPPRAGRRARPRVRLERGQQETKLIRLCPNNQIEQHIGPIRGKASDDSDRRVPCERLTLIIPRHRHQGRDQRHSRERPILDELDRVKERLAKLKKQVMPLVEKGRDKIAKHYRPAVDSKVNGLLESVELLAVNERL